MENRKELNSLITTGNSSSTVVISAFVRVCGGFCLCVLASWQCHGGYKERIEVK